MTMSCRLQKMKDATRFVLFETDVPNFEVATHGGSLFVVIHEGRPYGVTAKHNLHDFQWNQLIITDKRFGLKVAGLSAVRYAGNPVDFARDSDVLDVAIIEFSDDIDENFFEGTAYDISLQSIVMSAVGDALVAYGAISELSKLDDSTITPQFAELELCDVGSHTHDPVLRTATAKWKNLSFSSIAGLSGGPVFNINKSGLCGMTVRGTIREDGTSTIHYVDISDIYRMITAISDGSNCAAYVKSV